MRPDPRAYLWDAVRATERLDKFRHGKTFADYQLPDLARVLGELLAELDEP